MLLTYIEDFEKDDFESTHFYPPTDGRLFMASSKLPMLQATVGHWTYNQYNGPGGTYEVKRTDNKLFFLEGELQGDRVNCIAPFPIVGKKSSFWI